MGASAEKRAREAEYILTDSGAILQGDHFVYITGQHGDGWIDKDAVFAQTNRTSKLCGLLADATRDLGSEVVCGPATGGLVVSQWTGHHLGLPSVFCDHGKEHGYDPAAASPGPLRPPFVLKRGYDRVVSGKRVLVVDDVVNSGESLREAAEAVRGAGGDVAAAAALCTRGTATAADCGVETLFCVTEVKVPSWPAENCDLCRRGVPVNTRYAHGADFVAAQRGLTPRVDPASR